jgi:transposase
MTISEETKGKILRYYHVEKWRIGTIARFFSVHHSVVRRVLLATGTSKTEALPKSPKLEPYLPFIMDVFAKYPSIGARRVYDMVYERGYRGNIDHFRHLMALYRPKPTAEAYLRLRTLPGEQAQVDWGHFGHISIGRARRPLMAFVMVLSYSRKIFLQFFLNARMENFLRGHEAAFLSFNGVPRVLLYDNLRSLVLERIDNAIRFHPTMLSFASHYRYEPRPVAIARGNQKGRVERSIRYIRENFFIARTWQDLDDLNRQALAWCEGAAINRPCPEQPNSLVRDVFLEEQSSLLQLPPNPYPILERVEVKIGKTPYARFDLNDYSIPHNYVRKTLTVAANLDRVTILSGSKIIAEHSRSYDKGAQIETVAHIEELIAKKRKASLHSGQDRLLHAVPIAATVIKQAAERGLHMAPIIKKFLQLLHDYGVNEMTEALHIAAASNTPHPNSVRFILEQRRQEQNKPPLISLNLAQDKLMQEMIVTPHALTNYQDL